VVATGQLQLLTGSVVVESNVLLDASVVLDVKSLFDAGVAVEIVLETHLAEDVVLAVSVDGRPHLA